MFAPHTHLDTCIITFFEQEEEQAPSVHICPLLQMFAPHTHLDT